MTYRLSRKARNDLLKIFEDGLKDFGLAQAQIYRDKIEDSLKLIGENPEIARLRTEIMPPVRVHPVGVHMIIYTIEDKGGAGILRVRSGKENWIENPT